MSQPIKTPPVSDCWCGKPAQAYDWNFNSRWKVICEDGHSFNGECNSRHRAVCRWNNRIAAKKVTQ